MISKRKERWMRQKGRKAAALVMDSQAQKESAIGLLCGCSRVVLWH
jgi:hypothetical protein